MSAGPFWRRPGGADTEADFLSCRATMDGRRQYLDRLRETPSTARFAQSLLDQGLCKIDREQLVAVLLGLEVLERDRLEPSPEASTAKKKRRRTAKPSVKTRSRSRAAASVK